MCVTTQLKEEQLLFASETSGGYDLPMNQWPWQNTDSKEGNPLALFDRSEWMGYRKIQIYKVQLDFRKTL